MAASAAPAHAAINDFGGLNGADNDTFTTYAEDGFSVSTFSGVWDELQSNGNPAPAIYATVTSSIEVKRADSGTFTADGFYGVGRSPFGQAGYSIEGFVCGVSQFTESAIGGQVTDSNSSAKVDRMVITFEEGKSTSGGIDNIEVTATPVSVPASAAFMVGGLAVLGVARNRNRARPSSGCGPVHKYRLVEIDLRH